MPVRLALVQAAAPAHVTIRQGEHRLGLGQAVQGQLRLSQRPRLQDEFRLLAG